MNNARRTTARITRSAALLGAGAISLAGCTVGPKYHQPAATPQAPPMSYKETPAQNPDNSGDWKIAQPQDAMLHGKWWEIYNDAELNSLEEQLNIDNQNIKQYFENFMEARTLIAQARSQLFPTLGVGPSYTISRSSANLRNATSATTTSSGSGGSTTSTPNLHSTLISLPAEVTWEPDLWGKVRNTIHEAQYNAQLSAADLENERLTEQASLAVFFFELRGQDALQKVLDDTVAADEESVKLSRARYETGVDDQISLVEAQNALDNALAAATNLGVARAQYAHAIAVLIGTTPSGFAIPVKPLDAAPPAIPIGVPSQLLERRPDIAAAERNMAAANAQIGVVTAAYYPTLTLSGTAGFESSAIKNLLTWPSRFWSVGPSVSETIFDAGLRGATVKQYVAVYNADVASYRQTVLTAFQQVEDYLAATRILSRQIAQQQTAVNSAQQYLDLAKARYETGVDTYLNVLVAQTTLLSDQQSLASLRTQVMTSSVQLIEALGGGWDRSQLPSPAQVSEKVSISKTD
ncbi:MAG: efflux transporter outer membrane subunit [Candidatus Acidiferrum sp.]|jgi:NodT family efflux transporter outer membrane factor (OMF) lipoprotein